MCLPAVSFCHILVSECRKEGLGHFIMITRVNPLCIYVMVLQSF